MAKCVLSQGHKVDLPLKILFSVTHHINTLKEKNHMRFCTYAESPFNKLIC